MFYPKAMDIVFRTMAGVLPGRQRQEECAGGGTSFAENGEDNNADDSTMYNTSTQTETEGEDYVELLRLAYEQIRELEGKNEHLNLYTTSLKNRVSTLECENQALSSNSEILRMTVKEANTDQLDKMQTLLGSHVVDKFTALIEYSLTYESRFNNLEQSNSEIKEYLVGMDTRMGEQLTAFQDNISAANEKLVASVQESLKTVNSKFEELKSMTEQHSREQNTFWDALLDKVAKKMEDFGGNQNQHQLQIQESINAQSQAFSKDLADCGTSLRTLLSRVKCNDAELTNIRNQLQIGSTSVRELDVGLKNTKARLEEVLRMQNEQADKVAADIQNAVQRIDMAMQTNGGQRHSQSRAVQASTSCQTEDVPVPIAIDLDDNEPTANGDAHEANNNNLPAVKKRRVASTTQPNNRAKRMKRRGSVDASSSNDDNRSSGSGTQPFPIPGRSTVSDIPFSPSRPRSEVGGSEIAGSSQSVRARRRRSVRNKSPKILSPRAKPVLNRPRPSQHYSLRATPQVSYAYYSRS